MITILDLMRKIDSIPTLLTSTQRAQAAARRIEELEKELNTQFKIIEEESREIIGFFGGLTLDPTPPTVEMILPEFIDKKLLPTPLPKKKYQKVLAIIQAAKNPEGLSFNEIVEVWKALQWEDWHTDKLEQKLRDAIKTARSYKINIQHSGGHGGKFTIK